MSAKLNTILQFIRERDKNNSVRVKNFDNSSCEILDVISDSRDVKTGTLFAAIKGETSDGHNFINAAESNGASAILCEREVDSNLPQIIVPRVRDYLGEAASLVYNHPSSKLLMVGVTGTNGKTTTTYIIRSIFEII